MNPRGLHLLRRTAAGHRVLAAAALLGGAAMLFGACSSTAKGVDTCRRLESLRCERLASKDCNTDPDNPFQGDAQSCSRFYETQCGRGLQDGAREPSAAELKGCTEAISATCSVARDPLSDARCTVFLAPVVPVADTGTAPDTTPADTSDAAEAAAD
ncbi:MAG: hypothetical protein ABI175_21945 [Polyangiales bacterium]